MASRGEILSLYKRCLRSMMRIPDVDQRAVYRVYVRDGFRDKVALPEGCKQATNAINDAREQLERMDYYHSIREMKERQKVEQRSGGIGGSTGVVGASSPSTCSEPSSQPENDTRITTANVARSDKSIGDDDGEDEKHLLENDTRTTTSGAARSDESTDDDDGKDERHLFARNWLLQYIPHLHEEDVVAYSRRLVNDGFDCEESFLELRAEDLNFLKLAHRRAVVRALFS